MLILIIFVTDNWKSRNWYIITHSIRENGNRRDRRCCIYFCKWRTKWKPIYYNKEEENIIKYPINEECKNVLPTKLDKFEFSYYACNLRSFLHIKHDISNYTFLCLQISDDCVFGPKFLVKKILNVCTSQHTNMKNELFRKTNKTRCCNRL